MKIIDYKILVGNNNNSLVKQVENALPEWQPYGYPYVVTNGIERQAMVMYEEPKYPEDLTFKAKATKQAKKVKAND